MPTAGTVSRRPLRSAKVRAGLFIVRHPDLILLITAILAPGAGTLLVTKGQALENGGDWLFVLGGVVAIVLGGGVQWARDFSTRTLSKIDLQQAEAVRVAFKDALQPIAEMIADIPPLATASRQTQLDKIAIQATGALGLMLHDVEGLRVTVYKINEDRTTMECIAAHGRTTTPREPFHISDPLRGAAAFRLVARGGEPLFVPDIGDRNHPGMRDFHGSGDGYQTFITASINNRNDGWGMVSVDAAEPKSLVDTDKHIVSVVADLLAVAFAIIEGPATDQDPLSIDPT